MCGHPSTSGKIYLFWLTMKNKQTTLTRFVKDECANFNKHYQACLDDKPCKVLAGERCGFFERVVLGPPDYKYRLPDYDYAKLFGQYAEMTKTDALTVEQRKCDCGNSLRLRQRYCDACSRKRRKDSNRKYNRKRAG